MCTSNTLVASIGRVLESLRPTYQRLAEHHKVPRDVRVTGLQPEHFDGVLDLTWLFPTVDSAETMRRLSGTSETANYSLPLSTALLVGQEMIGLALVLCDGIESTAFLYAVIVIPRYRRTWATLYLKYQCLSRLLGVGFRCVAFEAYENNSDTLKHARKAGATAMSADDSCEDDRPPAEVQRTGLQEFGPQ